MKRLLTAALMSLSLLVVPASITHAAGPPQPDCMPEGSMCVNTYTGRWTDSYGYTISASWSVDVYSGNIISVQPSISPTVGLGCGPFYSPANPNTAPYPGPVTVYYTEPGSTTTISLLLYNGGTSSGSSGSGGPYC